MLQLTSVQRDILTALININRREDRMVKGEEIAVLIDRNSGTIRNQMQSLKSLGLVEAVPGPKGGYKATGEAYQILNLDHSGEQVVVPVVRNGVTVDGVSASEIVFDKVMNSQRCDGVIRIIGNIRDFNIGDEIEVGPTPANKLYLRGEVVGRDDTMSRLILRVKEMLSVPKIPVKKIARRAVRISPDISLREATRIMVYNGVQEALVEGSPPGLINLDDIVKAVADGRVNTEVGEIMIRGFLIIESDEPIYEAIKILGRTGASQLVVSEAGTAWGVVDHKDLIKSLSHT